MSHCIPLENGGYSTWLIDVFICRMVIYAWLCGRDCFENAGRVAEECRFGYVLIGWVCWLGQWFWLVGGLVDSGQTPTLTTVPYSGGVLQCRNQQIPDGEAVPPPCWGCGLNESLRKELEFLSADARTDKEEERERERERERRAHTQIYNCVYTCVKTMIETGNYGDGLGLK